MVEKEAKEYAQDMAKYYESAHDSIPSQFEKYLRKAVEYGYNKANEWHDLRKDPNDLPEECENVIINAFDFGINTCYVAHRLNGKWRSNCSSEIFVRVIAWKEIVLPEPSKYWDLSTGENNINKESE